MGRLLKIFMNRSCYQCMSLQQIEPVRVVANDLEIYFKGFEVALKKKNLVDAVRYLESMIEEIDYTIDRLESVKDHKLELENKRRDIKKEISGYRTGIKKLQGELKSL